MNPLYYCSNYQTLKKLFNSMGNVLAASGGLDTSLISTNPRSYAKTLDELWCRIMKK